jgi:putative flippase GtrA
LPTGAIKASLGQGLTTRLGAVNLITVFGVVVLSFMMLMYAFERRHPLLVLAFAVGCALSSVYGFISGAWPFGVVESIWCLVAVARYVRTSRARPVGPGQ